MSQLDHFAISRILGSTFAPFDHGRFGGFNAIPATGDMLASSPRFTKSLGRDDDRDAKIVEAFTRIYDGYSIDRVLAEPWRSAQFVEECRKLGLKESAAALNRRLLRLRKATDLPNKPPKATKTEKRDLQRFLIPAELASVQVMYRYDASIDDLLADPEIGTYFDQLATTINPAGTVVDYRLAALHLRKNLRSRDAADKMGLKNVGKEELAEQWIVKGPASTVATNELPDHEGVFALVEPNRYLYLTKYENVRAGVAQFQDSRALEVLGNRFWKPSLDRITIQIIESDKKNHSRLRLFELKGLEVYRPIFNLPLAA